MLCLSTVLCAPPFVFQPARMGGHSGGPMFEGQNLEEEGGFHN